MPKAKQSDDTDTYIIIGILIFGIACYYYFYIYIPGSAASSSLSNNPEPIGEPINPIVEPVNPIVEPVTPIVELPPELPPLPPPGPTNPDTPGTPDTITPVIDNTPFCNRFVCPNTMKHIPHANIIKGNTQNFCCVSKQCKDFNCPGTDARISDKELPFYTRDVCCIKSEAPWGWRLYREQYDIPTKRTVQKNSVKDCINDCMNTWPYNWLFTYNVRTKTCQCKGVSLMNFKMTPKNQDDGIISGVRGTRGRNGLGCGVWEHPHYQGRDAWLGEGWYTMEEMQAKGIPNDSISSLQVMPGFYVNLWEHGPGRRGDRTDSQLRGEGKRSGFQQGYYHHIDKDDEATAIQVVWRGW